MKLSTKIILPIILISTLLILLAGCFGVPADESTGYTPPEPEIIIPETTNIVDEKTELQLTSVSPDKSVITFAASTPQLEELIPGDILVMGVTEQTPYGLLRKVVNVIKGGKNGSEVVIETEFTSLEEAIEEGSFDFDITLTIDEIDKSILLPEGVKLLTDRFESNYEFNYDIDEALYEGDPSTDMDDITIDGYIDFDYHLKFTADFKGLELQNLLFKNTVESKVDLNVTLGGSVPLNNLIEPNPITLWTIPFTPITFWIPTPIPLPIVLTPKVNINLGVDGEIFTELTTGITITQQGTDALVAGAEFHNGNWSEIYNTPTFNLDPKLPSLSEGVNIKPYVGPQLECMLYDVLGGPYCNTYGNLELNADITSNPWWELYGGIDITAGVRLGIITKIWSLFWESPEFEIFDYRKLIAQADGPFGGTNPPVISDLTANPPSIDINQTTIITCTASDEDVGDAIYYTWSNNGGSFEGDTSGSSVTWRAPSTAGTYTVICEVSDGEDGDSKSVDISVASVDGDITNVSPLTDPFTLDTQYTTNVYVENIGNTSHTFKIIASEPSGTDFEITQKSLTLNAGASSSTSFKYQFYGTENCRTLTFNLYDSSNNLLDPYTTGSLCLVDDTTIPTVTTLEAYTITKTAATLWGEIVSTGGLTVTRRGFEYKDSAGGSTFDWHEDGDWSANDYIHRITGLVAGHTYLYRAYAVNDKGTGYGAWESFKTTEEIITSPSVTTVGADNIQETSIRFKGRIDDTGGEDADWRGFRIEDTVTGWIYSPRQESGPYGTGDYYITYITLSPGRTYKYKACAHNSAGTSYGTEKSVTTQASNQLTSIESSISSVSLKWPQMLMPSDYTITAYYNNGPSANILHINCTWSSSKPDIVYVNDGGIITPLVKTANSAVVTMTYTEGGITKSDTIGVTVIAVPGAITVTAVDNSNNPVSGNDWGFVLYKNGSYVKEVGGQAHTYTFTNLSAGTYKIDVYDYATYKNSKDNIILGDGESKSVKITVQ